MNAYAYNFQVSCAEIYEQVRKLKNFDETKTKGNSSVTFFMDRFKILLFAPVNDSKYANKVSEKAKEFDYSHGGGLPARGNGYSTPILYFRPLSYSFQLRNFHRFLKKYDIYIN